jgi:hypothetical protein
MRLHVLRLVLTLICVIISKRLLRGIMQYRYDITLHHIILPFDVIQCHLIQSSDVVYVIIWNRNIIIKPLLIPHASLALHEVLIQAV